jgi:hypothetical protein
MTLDARLDRLRRDVTPRTVPELAELVSARRRRTGSDRRLPAIVLGVGLAGLAVVIALVLLRLDDDGRTVDTAGPAAGPTAERWVVDTAADARGSVLASNATRAQLQARLDTVDPVVQEVAGELDIVAVLQQTTATTAGDPTAAIWTLPLGATLTVNLDGLERPLNLDAIGPPGQVRRRLLDDGSILLTYEPHSEAVQVLRVFADGVVVNARMNILRPPRPMDTAELEDVVTRLPSAP